MKNFFREIWEYFFPPKKIEVAIPVKEVPKPKPLKPKKPKIKKCMITDKVMYTREDAVKKRDELRVNRIDRYLRAYLCQFCGWWHLTHKKTY